MSAPRIPAKKGANGKPTRKTIRTVEIFMEIIRREYKKAPNKPIRLDIDQNEEVEVIYARMELDRQIRPAGEHSLDSYVLRQIMREMMPPENLLNTPPDTLAANPTASWQLNLYEIFGRANYRAVFYGPEYDMPLPLEFIPFTNSQGKGRPESFDDFVKRIASARGVLYHVEVDDAYLVTLPGRPQYISFDTKRPVHVKARTTRNRQLHLKGASVWRGEDWARRVCDAFWPSELPALMSIGKRANDLSLQALLAKEAQAQRDRCRAIQPLAIKARSEHRKDRTKYILEQNDKLSRSLMAKERDDELIQKLVGYDREYETKSHAALTSIVHRALGLKK